MARTSTEIAVPPSAVFAVLADGHDYDEWVVGAKHIRDVDAGWPEPGTKIHHTVGFGPFELKDETVVEEVDTDRRLVLKAKARPAGIARIVMTLEPTASGTKVVMEEAPISGFAKAIHNPVLDGVLKKRNDEALRRLKEHAEEEARRP